MPYAIWSDEEKDVLKKLYPGNVPLKKIMEVLPGRNHGSILSEAQRLGLRRTPPEPAINRDRFNELMAEYSVEEVV